MSERLVELCKNGDLDAAMKLYENNKTNANELFQISCIYGKLNIAQWLYSLGAIDIHADYDNAFQKSCRNGYLNIAQWLYSLGGVDVHCNSDYAFRMSCCNGKLDVAKWLYSLGNINIHIFDDNPLVWSCFYDRIEVIKWILSIDKFNNYIVDKQLPAQLYEHAFSLGYLPIHYMNTAYTEYKNKIKNEIKEKKEDGPINIFELEYLVDIISLYI